jgi:hypothetical protein
MSKGNSLYEETKKKLDQLNQENTFKFDYKRDSNGDVPDVKTSSIVWSQQCNEYIVVSEASDSKTDTIYLKRPVIEDRSGACYTTITPDEVAGDGMNVTLTLQLPSLRERISQAFMLANTQTKQESPEDGI